MLLTAGQHSCVYFLFSLLVSAVSHSYGYGLLDASAIVDLAKTWTTVQPQRKCVIPIVSEPRLVNYTHTRATHWIYLKTLITSVNKYYVLLTL